MVIKETGISLGSGDFTSGSLASVHQLHGTCFSLGIFLKVSLSINTVGLLHKI